MIRTLLLDAWRFLTFRPMSSAVQTHGRAYLTFGLVFTWLAGIGRYWDNPRAYLWQQLGLGSVAYVFVLALILWALLAPLRPRRWSYRNVLLFVTLTAPPAVLYAIPVERFLDPLGAVRANIAFLACVAIWRVALFVVFLRRTAGLSPVAVAVATLLPLAIIVVALSALNLEHVVFNIMGGLKEADRSPNDGAYGVVFTLALFSVFASPILAVGYAIMVYRAWRGARGATEEGRAE